MTTHLIREQESAATVRGRAFPVDRWVLLAAILAGGILATLSVMRYTGYNAGMLDLGNMSQAIWSVTRGRPLEFTYWWGNYSRLALHVELLYFLFVPFYALFPSPITLLIIQSSLFVAGTFPLHALATRRLEHPLAARCVVLIYLLYPVALTAVLFDFHGDTLALPLLMFMLNALDRRAWRKYTVWLILALSCKFYVAVAVAMMGVVLYLKGERRVAIGSTAASLLWGGLAFFVIRPMFAPAIGTEVQATASGYFSFYFGNLTELLQNPVALSQRLLTALVVFTPALWLGWRAALWLLPAGIVALPALLSVGDVSASDYRFHHYAISVPFLLAAIVYGAAALRQRQRNAPLGQRVGRPWHRELVMTLVITLMFTGVLIDIPLNPMFWIASPGWGGDTNAYGRTVRDAFKDRWLREQAPADAPVATSMFLAPHLINREVIYLFQYEKDEHLQSMSERLAAVDYAIADALFDFSTPLPGVTSDVQTGVPAITAVVGVGHQPASIGGVLHDNQAIAALLRDPTFGLVQARDGLLLFQRNTDPQQALSQRISVQKDAAATDLRHHFENGIGLRDVQITPLGERRFQLHFAWEVLPEWEPGAPFFAVSRLEGVSQARIAHLPTQALYPPQNWSPGEVVLEDFEIVLPDNLAPGEYTLWTAWYDSRHLFAAETDARSRVGVELQVGQITVQ